jgi:hypothetical protein
VAALIANTDGAGVFMRDAPGGAVIVALSEGAPVRILYQRERVNGVEWVEVRDLMGRVGWIAAQYVHVQP